MISLFIEEKNFNIDIGDKWIYGSFNLRQIYDNKKKNVLFFIVKTDITYEQFKIILEKSIDIECDSVIYEIKDDKNFEGLILHFRWEGIFSGEFYITFLYSEFSLNKKIINILENIPYQHILKYINSDHSSFNLSFCKNISEKLSMRESIIFILQDNNSRTSLDIWKQIDNLNICRSGKGETPAKSCAAACYRLSNKGKIKRKKVDNNFHYYKE